MVTRNIINHNGIVIGQLSLPDTTPESVWTETLAAYATVPQVLGMSDFIRNRINFLRSIAPALMVELYVTNTLAGITTAQSDQMFDDYEDVLTRLREGAWPTALYRLQQKVPSGFVTQQLIDAWISLIKAQL
jgi:hypothetical protein